jgi:hypothetical protein
MLKGCVLFSHPGCLQTISLLCLLLLVLPLQTLLAVVEHATLEQLELGATIHAAFNELEPIHLPFYRASTPRECQSCKDRIFVLLHAVHEGLKSLEMTGLDGSQPSIKLFSRTRQPPGAETLPPVARRFPGAGLPVSTVGGTPAPLLANLLLCGKRARLAWGAERAKRGLGRLPVFLLAKAEERLEGELTKSSQVAKQR